MTDRTERRECPACYGDLDPAEPNGPCTICRTCLICGTVDCARHTDAGDTLLDRIAQHMATDDEDRATQSRRLQETYESATALGKRDLDTAFIALCGWGLGTLLAGEDH